MMFSAFRPSGYRPHSGPFDVKANEIAGLLFLGLVSLACASPIQSHSTSTLGVPNTDAGLTLGVPGGPTTVKEPTGSPSPPGALGTSSARSPALPSITPGIIVKTEPEDDTLADWHQMFTLPLMPERIFKLEYRRGHKLSRSKKVISFLEMAGMEHTAPEGTPALDNRGFIRFYLKEDLHGEQVVALYGKVQSRGRYITGNLWDAEDIRLDIQGSNIIVDKLRKWSAGH
ncbi:hypothetical protein EV361DRAFT_865447 [Lentinula raphanica]|nr:hypothetical protein EV361DRAFT_865447 [Lentinula raphanica]